MPISDRAATTAERHRTAQPPPRRWTLLTLAVVALLVATACSTGDRTPSTDLDEPDAVVGTDPDDQSDPQPAEDQDPDPDPAPEPEPDPEPDPLTLDSVLASTWEVCGIAPGTPATPATPLTPDDDHVELRAPEADEHGGTAVARIATEPMLVGDLTGDQRDELVIQATCTTVDPDGRSLDGTAGWRQVVTVWTPGLDGPVQLPDLATGDRVWFVEQVELTAAGPRLLIAEEVSADRRRTSAWGTTWLAGGWSELEPLPLIPGLLVEPPGSPELWADAVDGVSDDRDLLHAWQLAAENGQSTYDIAIETVSFDAAAERDRPWEPQEVTIDGAGRALLYRVDRGSTSGDVSEERLLLEVGDRVLAITFTFWTWDLYDDLPMPSFDEIDDAFAAVSIDASTLLTSLAEPGR